MVDLCHIQAKFKVAVKVFMLRLDLGYDARYEVSSS